jgi:hypothetical protein
VYDLFFSFLIRVLGGDCVPRQLSRHRLDPDDDKRRLSSANGQRIRMPQLIDVDDHFGLRTKVSISDNVYCQRATFFASLRKDVRW